MFDGGTSPHRSLPALVDRDAGSRLLACVDGARTQLKQASDDFDRMRIRDDARRVEVAAALLGRRDIQVVASTLVQDAERAVHQANPPKKRGPKADNFVVPDNEIAHQTIRDIRHVHSKLDDEEYEAAKRQASDTQTPMTRAGLKLKPHVALRTGNNEWYTPPEIIKAARTVMGGIDLDPASSAVANERCVHAARFYTREDDGLDQAWEGKVWLNPPYSRGLVDRFVSKLLTDPGVEQAVALVNNGTETTWGQALLEAGNAVCFPRGRVRYFDAAGEQSGKPLQGQMIVGIRVDAGDFAETFRCFGVVANLPAPGRRSA